LVAVVDPTVTGIIVYEDVTSEEVPQKTLNLLASVNEIGLPPTTIALRSALAVPPATVKVPEITASGEDNLPVIVPVVEEVPIGLKLESNNFEVTLQPVKPTTKITNRDVIKKTTLFFINFSPAFHIFFP